MTKEEYEDFVLRYKGCGACFPMYHTLSRFEKMWFSAIQKDVANLEKELADAKKVQVVEHFEAYGQCRDSRRIAELEKENVKLKEFVKAPHTKGRKTTRGDYIKTVWDLSKQLAKAKEIIKDLMCFIGGAVALHDRKRNKDIDVEKLKADAENFLKESEVEK